MEISIQILLAIFIGGLNFAFTLYRTLEKGPRIIFPSPYFTIVKNNAKYSLQGLITNKGDQSTIVYLHAPSIEFEGKKVFASAMAANTLDGSKHVGSKFILNPGEFQQINFSIEVTEPNTRDLLLYMIYEYVDKSGKLKLDKSLIQFIPETYEKYQQNLSI